MADYDNIDKGAAFPPFEKQGLILQGKINSNGTDMKIVLVKDETKGGKRLIEIYQKVGVLFENDKKGNENAPDYAGPFEHIALQRRVAAWRRMKDGKPYMTLSVSDSRGEQAPVSNNIEDDIPW
jgi:hypothetical protein